MERVDVIEKGLALEYRWEGSDLEAIDSLLKALEKVYMRLERGVRHEGALVFVSGDDGADNRSLKSVNRWV